MRALLLGLLLWCACPGLAWAGPLALPPPPRARFAPLPGSALPLDARVTDSAGRTAALGTYFGRVPVVLVPGYYTCRTLCSTEFAGVLQALDLARTPATGYVVLGLSIDPDETPAAAAARRAAYTRLLPQASVHLLTAKAPALARLEHALGYQARRLPDGQYAHAAGFVVATPAGRIAASFGGVRFAPQTVGAALAAAGAGATAQGGGWALLCAHFDPDSGRYSRAAWWLVRIVALGALVGLAACAWHRGGKR